MPIVDSVSSSRSVRSAAWIFAGAWVGLLAGNLALATSQYAPAHAVGWTFVYSGALLIASRCLRTIGGEICTPALSKRFSRQAVVGHVFAGAHIMNLGGVCLSIWGTSRTRR